MGDEATGKIRLLAAEEGVVQMQLHRPLPDLGNFGIVDLDLIDGMGRERIGDEQNRRNDASSESGKHFWLVDRGCDPLYCLRNATAGLRRGNT
jgi:hypothetical protein